jgi:hypothetical protein
MNFINLLAGYILKRQVGNKVIQGSQLKVIKKIQEPHVTVIKKFKNFN